MWHELIQSGADDLLQNYKIGQSLLQSGVGIIKLANFIEKWGQLLQKRPVHLRDTRTNGNQCLATGSMRFGNGILRTFDFWKTFNKTISFNVCF